MAKVAIQRPEMAGPVFEIGKLGGAEGIRAPDPPRCELSAARSFTVIGASQRAARSPSELLAVHAVAVLRCCTAPGPTDDVARPELPLVRRGVGQVVVGRASVVRRRRSLLLLLSVAANPQENAVRDLVESFCHKDRPKLSI